MSEFLMALWAGAGCTPPLCDVARALVARGHDVRVLADDLLRADVEAAGAQWRPWTQAPQRLAHGRDGDVCRDWESDDPAENFALMRDNIAVGPAAAYAADVRDELARRPADVVLSEVLLLGPLVAAEAAGVPCVVLNPTINLVPAEGVPPFGFGLAPASTPEERALHAELGAVGLAGWDEALPALNAARAQHGLAPLEHVPDQWRSAARILVMTSRALDLPAELPPTVVHTGPRLADPAWAGSWEAPAGDGPLVLVGLSSDYQRQEEVLQRIVDGLAGLPVRALVTTGLGIDPSTVRAPGHVRVVRTAPHAEVLREAAAVVTHCGHGTTIRTLAAGVPLVAIPMGRDQHDVAVRAELTGAAIRLDPACSAGDVAGAVRRVLAEPAFGEAARRVARAIAEEVACDRVVEEVEEVATASRVPVPFPG